VSAAERGDAAALGDVIAELGIEVASGEDESERKALHVAAWRGHSECVALLLKQGADANAHSRDGRSPLHLAASCQVARQLLSAGARAEHEAFAAAAVNDAQKLRTLLRRDVRSASRTDDHGFSPLHFAAACGAAECAGLLLKAGASANTQTDHGATPLTVAAQNGHESAVRLLVRAGASFAPPGGTLALAAAARRGALSCMELLLSLGASPTAADKEGRTALHAAADSNQVACVRALLARKAGVNQGDSDGMTPLHVAASRTHAEK
jgi:ankyrin repeat protein